MSIFFVSSQKAKGTTNVAKDTKEKKPTVKEKLAANDPLWNKRYEWNKRLYIVGMETNNVVQKGMKGAATGLTAWINTWSPEK